MIRRFVADQLEPGRRLRNRMLYRSASMPLVWVSTHPQQSASSSNASNETVCLPDAFLKMTTQMSSQPGTGLASQSRHSESAPISIGSTICNYGEKRIDAALLIARKMVINSTPSAGL